jgi:hypothetical protein
MKTMFVISALLGLASTGLQAQEVSRDLSGDWQGSLHAGTIEIRLVVHISRNGAGGLKATFDSPDQGATGMKVAPILLVGSTLSFTVGKVNGSYEGNVNADGTVITGTWKQRLEFPLEFHRATSPITTTHKRSTPSDIDGIWSGTLNTGAGKLRLVFHVENTEDGPMATMDSPDQGAKGLPVTSVTRNGAVLRLEMKQLGGGFEGTISPDLSTIDGKWTQGGGSLPLVLTRER